jgi:hypothetical protein
VSSADRRLRLLRIVLLCALLCAGVAPLGAQMSWPSGAERVRGWREDLDSAITVFLAHDKSFDTVARATFARTVRQLQDSAAVLTDEQLIVRLATAVAGAHNAHTRLYLLRNRTVLRRYPVRVWWFKDDLYIIRAHPEHAELLGGKIVTIAGRSTRDVAARVAPLYTANRSWARYMSAYTMLSPEILKGIGVLQGSDTVTLVVQTRNGRRLERRLAPMSLERSDQPFEAWWDLGPLHPGRQGPWTSALPADTARLPLYLARLTRYYWMERLSASKVLYVQYNRSQDEPGAETVRDFGERLLNEIERDPPQKLVIDLRFNTGGNLELADPMFRKLAALPLAQERGRLFVITGRATFSAGITHAALLRQLTQAVFVGEPVGDVLDFWAEGGNIVLPNTKLTLHYANGFHTYSPRDYPQFRPYAYDLNVENLAPAIVVEPTIDQYLAGKDPAMTAILGFVTQRGPRH